VSASSSRAASGRASTPRVDGCFVLYVEGPRDRSLLEAWAWCVSAPLARALPPRTVILGGCQPARAVEHFRAVRERHDGARGLCVLDRDGAPRRPPAALEEPGLELFTWGRRHIESYLLVPEAIRRSARLADDDPRVERYLRAALPDPDDEEAYGEFPAKPLFALHGGLQKLLGRPVRPARVARSMRREELHEDVRTLLERLGDALGLREPDVAVRRRLVR
jgi:hypothetical protein